MILVWCLWHSLVAKNYDVIFQYRRIPVRGKGAIPNPIFITRRIILYWDLSQNTHLFKLLHSHFTTCCSSSTTHAYSLPAYLMTRQAFITNNKSNTNNKQQKRPVTYHLSGQAPPPVSRIWLVWGSRLSRRVRRARAELRHPAAAGRPAARARRPARVPSSPSGGGRPHSPWARGCTRSSARRGLPWSHPSSPADESGTGVMHAVFGRADMGRTVMGRNAGSCDWPVWHGSINDFQLYDFQTFSYTC